MAKKLRTLTAAVAAASLMGGLAACSSDDNGDGSSSGSADGSVYFLNWKPESEAAYQKIAEAYTQETGVPVKVATAASNTYEQTLTTEITKSDAPTLFNINGPVGLKNWQDYALDLTDTEFAKNLRDENLALKSDDGTVYGVPLAVEGYGIIYNQEIMDQYFALDGAKVASVDEIKGFDKLKEVVEDMQARKDELGIDGVFASTSLATGEDWRWQTHTSNIPVFWEFNEDGVTDKQEIEFRYSDEFKNIFDLYLQNSTVEPTLTPSKTVTDSMAEFAQGKAAMVQNGNWAWSQIAEVDGNVVQEDAIKFMPIYTGHDGEDAYGIPVGTEAFMAINSQASEADQQATIDFVNWLFSSDEGRAFVVNDLGFNAPFTTFSEDEVPNDPLAKQVAAYTADESLSTIPWVFTAYPSQKFKDDFGGALAQYASGNMEWDQVVSTFVDGWASEKSLAN